MKERKLPDFIVREHAGAVRVPIDGGKNGQYQWLIIPRRDRIRKRPQSQNTIQPVLTSE